ncbi:hypothetical protein RI129_003673 [Pyrocoelia pectoralis]|uniref:ascorbate ferrireductase (transmembrane) n=1 Tax=Pyrocoelia pectoralis TaxID=417401 RepID=A0AAN7VQS8_9COLE
MNVNGTSLDTVLRIGKLVLNGIFHLCVAGLTVYTIWLPITSYTWPFSWHVILCTLGILPLITESLIVFSKQNIWSQEIDRKQKHWIHVILIISIGGLLIFIGVGFEIYRIAVHTDPTVKHFSSPHSITGLIGIIFIINAMVCGVLAFNTQRIYKWNRKARPIYFKLIHNILGQAAYLLCLISFCLGHFIPWFVKNLSDASRITAMIVAIIVAIWSMICAWRSLFSKITFLRNV